MHLGCEEMLGKRRRFPSPSEGPREFSGESVFGAQTAVTRKGEQEKMARFPGLPQTAGTQKGMKSSASLCEMAQQPSHEGV